MNSIGVIDGCGDNVGLPSTVNYENWLIMVSLYSNMVGVEYSLLHCQDPILYIVRKQMRHSPTQGRELFFTGILGMTTLRCYISVVESVVRHVTSKLLCIQGR